MTMTGHRVDRWACVAMATPKPADRNQDRAVVVRLPDDADGEPIACGVVVCDGVGAMKGSGAVAEQAAETGAEYIAGHGVLRGILGSDDNAGDAHAILHCAQHVADEMGAVDDGATTFLAIGADARGVVAFSYVGNGALLDVEPVARGEFPVRASTAELVTPHIAWANGRPALRAVIPPLAGTRVVAARGMLYPQPDRARVLLAVTDGIASHEDVLDGTSDGARWRMVPKPLAAVIAAIESDWANVLAAPDPGARLGDLLQTTLDSLTDGVLSDDATVGALLLVPRPSPSEQSDGL